MPISICAAVSVQPGEIKVRVPGPERRSGAEVRRSWPGGSEWPTGPAPAWLTWGAVALLLLAGAVVLEIQTRGTTFWADEWNWILTRRGGGIHTFLNPHNEHLSLVPVTIYKILFATVGLRHYWPYRAVLIALDLGSAFLVFAYARSRIGAYFALLASALILFFGPGWQDILWPFQIAWLSAIAAGIGALLALDRRDRLGDVAACLLLGVSLASAGPGLAVAAGLVIDVALRRRRRDLWIVAIPIAFYGLWWIGFQHTMFSAHALLLLPTFVFDAAAGALSALAGLTDLDVFHGTGLFLNWGPPLLLVAVTALLWRLYQLGRVPSRVWTLLTMPLAFWVLTAVGRAYVSVGPLVLTSTGYESRYLYVSAVFLVLLGSEVSRGHAASLIVRLAAGVLVTAAVVSNVGPLRQATTLLRTQAQITQAELGTLNLSRPVVKPNYVSNGFIFGIVTAAEWFAVEKQLGAGPAATPAQIAALPSFAQDAADSQLIKIQQLELHGVTTPPALGTAPRLDGYQSGTISVTGACVRYIPAAFTPASATNALEIVMPASGLLLGTGGAPATVSVRRFSSHFVPLGTLSADARATLRVAPDLAPQPWHVQITGDGPLTACGLA